MLQVAEAEVEVNRDPLDPGNIYCLLLPVEEAEVEITRDPLDPGEYILSIVTSSVADPWYIGVDPGPDPQIHVSGYWIRIQILDPDPAIFVIDLQDANIVNTNFVKQIFLLITFWKYIYIIFQR